MESYLISIMLFLLTGSPRKLKLEKIHDTSVILFDVSPSSSQVQRNGFLLKKDNNNNNSSASDWWEYMMNIIN